MCAIQQPYYCCPFCFSELLTSTERESLLVKIEGEIEEILEREAKERMDAAEDARKTAGAFPALGQTGAGRKEDKAAVPPRPLEQQHKVLSLDLKTKKVTMVTPSSPPPKSSSHVADREIRRVPQPPVGVTYVKQKEWNEKGKWENFGSEGGALYVAAM